MRSILPKLYVCHARGDREKFLPDFTRQFMRRGLVANLERWEMGASDSLVDRIFEEGMKDAGAFVIVLSKQSVNMKWLGEDLDFSSIRRIGDRLIPVAIEACEIPFALRNLKCETISESHHEFMERIERTLSLHISTQHVPVEDNGHSIAGLDRISARVLELSCDAALESGSRFIRPAELPMKEDGLLFSAEELDDALEILDRDEYIRLFSSFGSGHFHFHITLKGFEAYAQECIPDFREKVQRIGCAAYATRNSQDLAIELGEPQLLVDHVLENLEHHGYLKLARLKDGPAVIYDISPELLTRSTGFARTRSAPFIGISS